MEEFEEFSKIVSHLVSTKNIKQQSIAETIGVNRTSFSLAVSGARKTKVSEYIPLLLIHYKDELRTLGDTILNNEKYTTQKQAWDLVLEKQEEILRGINQILENQNKAK